MADTDTLRALAHDAWKLHALAGGLDTLHEAMPATVHPGAGPVEQRATDALGPLIEAVIARVESLASRLDRAASVSERSRSTVADDLVSSRPPDRQAEG